MRTLAGALVAAQAPANESSQSLQTPTALDLAITVNKLQYRHSFNLHFDSLPVADVLSIERHHVSQTEQLYCKNAASVETTN